MARFYGEFAKIFTETMKLWEDCIKTAENARLLSSVELNEEVYIEGGNSYQQGGL